MDSTLNPVVWLNRNAVESHLKRKSLGLIVTKATPIGERDGREEGRIRQTEGVAQQRPSIVQSGTPSRAPVSSTGVVMSCNQLKEHYMHCIQLSITNKINVKNAFGLHLIDFMSELIKQSQKDQGFVNFKLAGSALDAGAKIYCNRVDSVYAEAQKMASSLVMALNNDKYGYNPNGQQNGDNVDQPMEDLMEGMDDEEGPQRTKRKKTTKNNVKTLAQNIESLNILKVETNLEIDPVFHHLSAAFDVGNVNSLLMANLKTSPSGMLLLDSNSSLNFDDNHINEPKMQNITKFYTVFNDVSKSSAKVCPQLSSFEFLNRDHSIDLITREEDPSYVRRDSFAFNLNAEVEDIEDMAAGDVLDNNEDALTPENTVKKSLIKAINMEGVGDLVKMLSDRPNDYNYFNPKLMSSWAAPKHWKRVPFWNKKCRVKGHDNDPNGEKPRRQRRPFPEFKYSQKEGHILSKSELKPKVATLTKWPEMERYDYDDIPTGGFTDPLELGQSVALSQLNANTNAMTFVGDNLVEQPYELQQYNIPYVKFAKNMDVKKLKSAMWDVISPVSAPNTPMNAEMNVIRQNPDMNFVNLYKTLPQRITPVMAQNLSASIAFVALLQLCNERNLKLIGAEDLSDFHIESEDQ